MKTTPKDKTTIPVIIATRPQDWEPKARALLFGIHLSNRSVPL